MYQFIYQSPLGPTVLLGRDGTLLSIYSLDGQTPPSYPEEESPGLQAGSLWFRAYFQGDPLASDGLPLAPQGIPFQRDVWALLRGIPYGQATSHGALARVLAKKYGWEKMSARAVGVALAKNPLAIVLPRHRVLDGKNFLRGCAWGLETKKALLEGKDLKIVQGKVIQPSLVLFKGLQVDLEKQRDFISVFLLLSNKILKNLRSKALFSSRVLNSGALLCKMVIEEKKEKKAIKKRWQKISKKKR